MSKVKKIEVTEVLPPLDTGAIATAIKEIKDAYRESSASILRLADAVYRWSNHKDWAAIEKQLDEKRVIGESLRKKLLRIGANAILMKEEHWEKLPSGYQHLYPLTQIEPATLEKLIEEGAVYQGMTVEESNLLKNEYRAKKPPAERKAKTLTFTIRIKISAETKNIKSEMKSQVSALKKHLYALDESAVIELL